MTVVLDKNTLYYTQQWSRRQRGLASTKEKEEKRKVGTAEVRKRFG